jgi:hypothetical protein
MNNKQYDYYLINSLFNLKNSKCYEIISFKPFILVAGNVFFGHYPDGIMLSVHESL